MAESSAAAASRRRSAATQLRDAAAAGDVERMRQLLGTGSGADGGDYDQRTALHLAAAEGQLGAVRFLVEEARADPSVVDRWGGTPLEDALRDGKVAVAEYLRSVVPTKSAEQGPLVTGAQATLYQLPSSARLASAHIGPHTIALLQAGQLTKLSKGGWTANWNRRFFALAGEDARWRSQHSAQT